MKRKREGKETETTVSTSSSHDDRSRRQRFDSLALSNFYKDQTQTSRVTERTQFGDQSLHRPPRMKRKRASQETAPAASASSSHNGRSEKDYEVFLSFRGPDGSLTIADVLYHDMTRAGICVFMADEKLRIGEEIEDSLLQAINDSRIYILIFSRGYASSKWCLRELTRIIDLSRDNDEKVILPIFCGVDANDVKLKTELYREALREHESNFGKDLAKTWEKALKEVGRIKGMNLKDHGLDGLKSLIFKEVSSLLWTSRINVPDDLVGIKDGNVPAANSEHFSFYPMPEMKWHDALRLFCERALGCAKPPPNYRDISNKLINMLGRLPLALDVVGSTLRGQCPRTWENVLDKLKKVMNEDVKKKLMISYEALGS